MVDPSNFDVAAAHDALQHSLQTSSQWLADAAAAASTENNGGWWSAYLNIFKTALSAVHNTIDGPLRSIGVEQTWGPSIALFTAGV